MADKKKSKKQLAAEAKSREQFNAMKAADAKRRKERNAR